jgi:hypothetical protein
VEQVISSSVVLVLVILFIIFFYCAYKLLAMSRLSAESGIALRELYLMEL